MVVGGLHSIGSVLHGLQHGRVCVCTLQRLPLHLYGRQSAVDLLELLLVLLLPFQGLDRDCGGGGDKVTTLKLQSISRNFTFTSLVFGPVLLGYGQFGIDFGF